MYRILLIDQSAELPVSTSRSNHHYRVPRIGEHVFVKWKDVTKACEVEDVWTHLNLDNDPYQGAVQVVVRWAKGIDPALYVRRFR
jgi:hypothetical protein